MMVNGGEDLFGNHTAVVAGPTPKDWVEPTDDCGRVGTVQRTDLYGQPSPEPPHRRRAGFDEQLAVVAADVESEEVEPVVNMDDLGFVLVER